MDNYLKILEESLVQKLKLLEEIQSYNKAQQEVFSSENPDMERFDEYIEEKGRLIESLNKLDEGFEILYAKVAEELKINRERYTEQIKRMQQMITEITERSVSIQAQEARNKALIEAYFAKQKTGIRESRRNSKAVYDYYQSINKPAYVESQFMDSRK